MVILVVNVPVLNVCQYTVCVVPHALHYASWPAGADAHMDALGVNSVLMNISSDKLLDGGMGRMYTMDLNYDFLLRLLSPDRPEAQRLAALHCLLVHLESNQDLEKKVRR